MSEGSARGQARRGIAGASDAPPQPPCDHPAIERGLLDLVPMPLLCLDAGLRVVLSSRSFRAAFSPSRDPDGLPLEEVLPFPGLREKASEGLGARRPLPGQLFETPGGRESARFLQVTMAPAEIPGHPARLLLVVEDVTEQMRLVAAVRQARGRLDRGHALVDTVLDNMEDGVVACDAKGDLVFFNRAARDLYGVPADPASWPAAYALRGADGNTPLGPEEMPLRRALRGEAVKDQEVVVRPRGGKPRTLLVSARRMTGAKGQPFGAVCVARDVTDRLRSEEQLRQAQKFEVIGSLAGGVAHDFNNILTAILGYSGFLADRLGAGHAARREVDEIRRAAERGAGLTRQLLAFSRRQTPGQRLLDLNEVASGMEPMLRRLIGEDIELVTSPATGPARVHADRGKLEQVVMNLAVNARDAMPKGGRLAISVTEEVLDEPFALSHPGTRPGPHAVLSVSDSGIGMDAETRSHLFEPFFTTKGPERGTGLGLATVYGIVQQHGGGITVESEPGRGSTFRVHLPRAEEDAAAPGPGTAEVPVLVRSPVPRGTETVLLVEDEHMVRALLKEVLRAGGYRVVEARDGQEGLEAAGRHAGAIHLVVTDVVMPRLNGRDMVDRLREMRPGLRVLFMSGDTDRYQIPEGVPHTGFLRKPFTPLDISKRIRELLDAPA